MSKQLIARLREEQRIYTNEHGAGLETFDLAADLIEQLQSQLYAIKNQKPVAWRIDFSGDVELFRNEQKMEATKRALELQGEDVTVTELYELRLQDLK